MIIGYNQAVGIIVLIVDCLFIIGRKYSKAAVYSIVFGKEMERNSGFAVVEELGKGSFDFLSIGDAA